MRRLKKTKKNKKNKTIHTGPYKRTAMTWGKITTLF